jgi:hypothetical protein
MVAAFAVGVGFVGGFVVFQFYRAWQDEAVEDARRQFQALYSDPNTDLDDLPSDLPRCAQANDCAAAAGRKRVSYVLSHSCKCRCGCLSHANSLHLASALPISMLRTHACGPQHCGCGMCSSRSALTPLARKLRQWWLARRGYQEQRSYAMSDLPGGP